MVRWRSLKRTSFEGNHRMEGAMHAAYEATEQIQKKLKNPKRNP
jgi:hypothetical protein